MRPLKLYLYREGIVRFSSDRYDCASLKNHFSHLTNTSINKNATASMSCAYGSGIKWTFEALRKYFLDNGMPWDLIWVKIEILIIATCITLCQLVPDLECCMELLGFDVILDKDLKPWLLEVNGTPAMAMDG